MLSEQQSSPPQGNLGHLVAGTLIKDKDAFPEASVRAMHEKLIPKHEKNPKLIGTHQINQPRNN